ncbi:nitrilase-related carbon-nitrogen hydrolase, partial [Pseudomonas juntendi]
DETGRCMASYLTMTAAHVNNVYIAAANRIGSERGGRFLGCSLIAGTNGWPIGAVASAEEESIVYADVDLSSARSAPIWNSLNDLQRDRRTDLYDAALGYRLHAPMPR